MNWQGADRVALALARLAARLAGLGPLVSLVDDIRRPPTVSAGREPALDDVVRTVSRALQDIPELRRNVSSSQMESAVLALVERLDRIPKGADPLLCYRPASLQAVLSQADTLVQRRLGDEAAFSFYCRLRNEASLAIAHSLVSAPNAAALIARELYVRQDDPVVSEWRSQLQIEQHRQYHRWMLASHSYLMRVLDSLNYFDSPGVDLGESDWRRELSDVFVCPTIGGHSRNVSLREVEELLGRGSATLVTGLAGSGKSSLFRYLALTSAANVLKNGQSALGLVPFLVKLRELNGEYSLKNSIVRESSGHAVELPNDFVFDQVDSGHALLLFDGLDEIAPSERRRASAWIGELAREYCRRGTSLVVSTRREVSSLKFEPFRNVELSLVSRVERHQLVESWSRALASREAAWRVAAVSPDEYLLATNNRLDTFLAVALPLQGRDAKVSRRADDVAGMWSFQRDHERGIHGIGLEKEARESILGDLALSCFSAGGAISRERALGVVIRRQSESAEPRFRDAMAGEVLTELVTRTSLLNESRGTYSIAKHQLGLTLASRTLLRDLSVIRTGVLPLETLPSSVGAWIGEVGTASDLDAFLDAVLNSPSDQETRARLIIAACAAAGALSEQGDLVFRTCVMEALRGRWTNGTSMVAQAGRAGARIVSECAEQLHRDGSLHNAAAALSRSGSDESITVLARLATSADSRVRDTLVQGFQYATDPSYGTRVLASLPGWMQAVDIDVEATSSLRLIDSLPEDFRVHVTLGPQDEGKSLGSSTRRIDSAALHGWSSAAIAAFLSRNTGVVRLHCTGVSGDLGATAFPETASSVRYLTLDATAPEAATRSVRPRASASSGWVKKAFGALDSLTVRGPLEFTLDAELNVNSLEAVSIDFLVPTGGRQSVVRHLALVDVDGVNVDWIKAFGSVEELDIYGAPELTRVSFGRWSPRLRSVKFRGCPELAEVVGIELLSDLEWLQVDDCERLAVAEVVAAVGFVPAGLELAVFEEDDEDDGDDSIGGPAGPEYEGSDGGGLSPARVADRVWLVSPTADAEESPPHVHGVHTSRAAGGPSMRSLSQPWESEDSKTVSTTQVPGAVVRKPGERRVPAEDAIHRLSRAVFAHTEWSGETRNILAWLDWLAAAVRAQSHDGVRLVDAAAVEAVEADPTLLTGMIDGARGMEHAVFVTALERLFGRDAQA